MLNLRLGSQNGILGGTGVKERTKLELFREVQERGYDGDGDGMSHPQIA